MFNLIVTIAMFIVAMVLELIHAITIAEQFIITVLLLIFFSINLKNDEV